MILCDDFDGLILKQDEVFNVIDQGFLVHQAVDEIVGGNTVFADGFAVDSLALLLLQPLKEIVKGSVERTKPSFKTVGKHADLIKRKEVGDVLNIAF